jgi:hypothetical protein
MALATEYRDAYCWFFGGSKSSYDSFQALIQSKMDGTFEGEFPKPIPQFAFELRQPENAPQVIPNASNVVPFQNPKAPSTATINKARKEAAKKAAAEREYQKSGASRSHFHNYGRANVNPPNPDLFMTTFNVKAPTGVNPHTLMKGRIRPFVLAEFAKPRPVTAVHLHQPKFLASRKDATSDEKLQMDGPFWACWSSSEPFPEGYEELEALVRPNSK